MSFTRLLVATVAGATLGALASLSGATRSLAHHSHAVINYLTVGTTEHRLRGTTEHERNVTVPADRARAKSDSFARVLGGAQWDPWPVQRITAEVRTFSNDPGNTPPGWANKDAAYDYRDNAWYVATDWVTAGGYYEETGAWQCYWGQYGEYGAGLHECYATSLHQYNNSPYFDRAFFSSDDGTRSTADCFYTAGCGGGGR